MTKILAYLSQRCERRLRIIRNIIPFLIQECRFGGMCNQFLKDRCYFQNIIFWRLTNNTLRKLYIRLNVSVTHHFVVTNIFRDIIIVKHRKVLLQKRNCFRYNSLPDDYYSVSNIFMHSKFHWLEISTLEKYLHRRKERYNRSHR